MHTSTTSNAVLSPWLPMQLQQATQGQWYLDQVPSQPIARIVTDSRQAKAGDAFLALKGERFDGHAFAAQVVAQGASLLIVSQAIADLNVPQLLVSDTRLALGHLGAWRRQQCTDLKVIALTGSSGKTTTKEMLGSILSALAPTLVTRGNLNNDLGVPMMLLELRPEHRYAVMELGANHLGEINYTSNLVQPHVAGILNIGTAHMGEFGGRDAICRAKSEIYSHILPHGTAIVPSNDEYAEPIARAASDHAIIAYGVGGTVYPSHIQLNAQTVDFQLHTPQGQCAIHLPFAGAHNVENACAAAAFAVALDVALSDIKQGLEQAKGAQGRLNFIHHQQHLFIDDTYNANPTSMRAAAQVLAQQNSLKIMVMGDIGELGDSSESEHRALGRDLVEYDVDHIIAVGEFAPAIYAGAQLSNHANKVSAFPNQAQALEHIQQHFLQQSNRPCSWLFKGSRYTHMEHLLKAVMEKI